MPLIFLSKTKEHINKVLGNASKVKRVGEYNNGHLYGLHIHKNRKDPRLWPVILMSGTVTHNIAQHTNKLIRLYIKKTYIIYSSKELVLKLNLTKIQNIDCLESLDVESLSTNVPVKTITSIIFNKFTITYPSNHTLP